MEPAWIPPFEWGDYVVDLDGVIYHPDRWRSDAARGAKPSTMLRRYLLYVQRGRCADCERPEWAISRSLQIHRLQKDGLYSIRNTVLICSTCHGIRHRKEA